MKKLIITVLSILCFTSINVFAFDTTGIIPRSIRDNIGRFTINDLRVGDEGYVVSSSFIMFENKLYFPAYRSLCKEKFEYMSTLIIKRLPDRKVEIFLEPGLKPKHPVDEKRPMYLALEDVLESIVSSVEDCKHPVVDNMISELIESGYLIEVKRIQGVDNIKDLVKMYNEEKLLSKKGKTGGCQK